MPHEIEAKFRIGDPQALRVRLAEAGARQTGIVFEVNRILDTPDRRLRQADRALRIRETRRVDLPGEPPAPVVTITFKGPRDAAAIRSREELESIVDHAPAMVAILGQLGFVEQVLYEKRREHWWFDPCRVALDELPRLGWFVELEGPSVAAIEQARTRLGLADRPVHPETYVELAARHGVLMPDGRRELRFASGAP